MFSPRRGLLSPCPIGGAPWPPQTDKEEGKERESEAAPRGKGEREGRSLSVRTEREKRGALARGEIYLPEFAVAKSSQESVGQPTTDREARPPHYAHRSRDFNVPVETTGAPRGEYPATC